MTLDVTIRPARPDEAEALTELVMRSKAHWGYSEEFMESCRDELRVHAEEMVPLRMTVAEAEGRVVAVASLDGQLPEGELLNLFVEPDVIGKGVGRTMFQHMADTARGVGFRTMALDADPNAEPFYEAMGCVRVGVVPSGSIPGRTLNRYAFEL
ncbi:N-acetylglutamate synthase-like GNAT family acetyltransferase [Catenulispora sp. GAS73]